MRVKIINGSGWYRDMKGREYDVIEDTRSGGLLYFINEDVVSDKSTVRFISPEDCEIIPSAQDSSELEALRARLTATEAALTAARELIRFAVPKEVTGNDGEWYCDICGYINKHRKDCLYIAYAAAVARLQEMTE